MLVGSLAGKIMSGAGAGIGLAGCSVGIFSVDDAGSVGWVDGQGLFSRRYF